eukprot:TRINITY_DN17_c0_g1_i6.p1 TRINITY_DN17_c0_g1~~TRINITY_DN17_c0_g1_i6.p1  ORF type:complete len:401 (+),score=152.58 TRINITY_DN17_c0_g1_i6:68-1270(+)
MCIRDRYQRRVHGEYKQQRQKMRYVALVTLALVFGATIAIDPRVTALVEKCQSTSFGKTLYGTLELELSSGQPGQYLVNLLNGMVNTVKNDITRADNNHNEFQASCTQDINSLQEEVRSHVSNVRESNEIISKANQRLAWDKVELENSQRQLGDTRVNREKLIKNREEEAKEYDQKVSEINEALETLHQGLNLVRNNLGGGAALVQVASTFKEHVRKMTSLIQNKAYRGRGYVSLINFIAELVQAAPVQANRDTVNRVLELIQGIIDELERAKNIEYQAEQERIKNYEEILAIYDRTIVELERKIDSLTNSINQLEGIINFNKNRITDNTRQIQIKKRQQIKLKKECANEQKAYVKDNEKRNNDYSLVYEALAIVKENIEAFRNIVLNNSKANIDAAYSS